MIWVVIFCAVAVAVAGLVMVIAYGVWLAHKASDVFHELEVLADRGGKIAELLAEIEVPEAGLETGSAYAGLTVDSG